jgi:hypothetical protein
VKVFNPIIFCVFFSMNCIVFGSDTIITLPLPDGHLSIDNLPTIPDSPPLITEIFCPVIYGQGRQLSVGTDEIPGNEPWGWHFFPWNEPTPATPDQNNIILTESDPLVIAVPMFAFQPWVANFSSTYSRDGNQLQLDGFSIHGDAMTATMYGPIEYLESIGTLEVGHYTLKVRGFSTWDSAAATLDVDTFKSDPEGYAYSHNTNLTIINQTLDFTVVPEPGTANLLGLGLLSLFIKRMTRFVGIG